MRLPPTLLILFLAFPLSSSYTSTPFCTETACTGDSSPSLPYYIHTNGSCLCATPLSAHLSLSLSLNISAPFGAEETAALRTGLGILLAINSTQVWVPWANSMGGYGAIVAVEIFPPAEKSFSFDQLFSILNLLHNKTVNLGPLFKNVTVVDVSFATVSGLADTFPRPPQVAAPPSPPPPAAAGKGGSGFPMWATGYVVLGGIAALLLPALFVCWILSFTSQKSLKWYPPISSHSSGTLQSRSSAALRSLGRSVGVGGSSGGGAGKLRRGASNSTGARSGASSKSLAQQRFGQKVAEYFVREVSLEEVALATGGFAEDAVLGVGGYGTVYRGRSRTGEDWAVKRAKRKADTGVEDFQNEVDVISKMSHRNLVRLLGYCDEKNEQILIYEYVPRGTLRQRLKAGAVATAGAPSAELPETSDAAVPPKDFDPADPAAPLSFQQRLEIAIGAAEGLRYLHSFAKPPIIHRDVKSDNILLDNELQAKVADFGVFKHLQTPGVAAAGGSLNTKVVGTPGYLDPEYYQTYKVTAKSDVYSFGVVLLELITGQPSIMADPTAANDNVMVTLARWAIPKIAAGRVEAIADPGMGAAGGYPRQALQMLASVAAMCVRRQARDRPEMAEVATRLNEIKYFLQPSSGILSDLPVDEPDALGTIPEFIPGANPGESGATLSTAENTTAPVSMVFSDR